MWDRTRNQLMLLYIVITLVVCFVFGFYMAKYKMNNNTKNTCSEILTNIEEHEIKSAKIYHKNNKSYMELKLSIPYSKSKEIKKEDIDNLRDHYRLDYINTNYLD